MTKSKSSSTSNKPISFRFKPEVRQVLNELVGTKIKCAGCGKEIKNFTSRIDVIEDSLAGLVAFLLHRSVAEQQIKENRRNPRQLFRLYLMVCRADRGEKGYGFTDKDKKKRFVYGPKQAREGVYTHMFEEQEKKEGLVNDK